MSPHQDPPHGQDRRPAPGTVQPHDPAGESLSNALRASFRLLTLIMIVVVVAFFLTGLRTIEPSQVGVIKVFGRIVGTSEPGLAITWPFPIGDIEIVSTDLRNMMVEDKWPHQTPEEKAQNQLPRPKGRGGGLRPGWDGALLTGDRNLYHLKVNCTYRVKDAVDYTVNLGGQQQAEQALKAVICSAAVRVAGGLTADGLQRTDIDRFKGELLTLAQSRLDDVLSAGIQIVEITIPQRTWPVGALQAYNDAQRARSEMEQKINEARAEAEEILNSAAGASYRRLVSLPWLKETGEQSAESQGLIDRYVAARDQGDLDRAGEVLDEIRTALTSNEIGGKASEVISEARGYKTTIVQAVEGRAKRFLRLVDVEEKDLLMHRLWADAREEILSRPTVEKYYLPVVDDRTVIYINRDPQTVRELQTERLREQRENMRQQEIERLRRER
jgi:membrane protease subunit HflK